MGVMAEHRLLIATTNPGKVREVREILAGTAVEVCSLAELPPVPEAVEDGATFAQNARIKALHYAGLAPGWVLADDSGLEVDALDGAPGVHSARYAGPEADAAQNNAKLVAALAGVPAERRTARFRCHLVLAQGNEVLEEADGSVEGIIVDEPAGTNGFGYDPHFFLPDRGVTVAQLPPEEKNRISHRGRALEALLPRLMRRVTAG
jgi:XTP/dITP diphosphohydrolase